jgi:hypothetical protein
MACSSLLTWVRHEHLEFTETDGRHTVLSDAMTDLSLIFGSQVTLKDSNLQVWQRFIAYNLKKGNEMECKFIICQITYYSVCTGSVCLLFVPTKFMANLLLFRDITKQHFLFEKPMNIAFCSTVKECHTNNTTWISLNYFSFHAVRS